MVMGRFIITGGPGSGKTTLVEALQNLGYYGFPEIARDLINKGIVPPIWSEKPDSGHFFDLILKQRIIYFQQIKGTEIGFYDRGIPDSLAYFKYQDKKVPPILSEAIIAYRYNPVVFITPPWKEIFNNDGVRRETFYEAQVLYELATVAYKSHGYEIIVLPKSSLESRITIVLSEVAKYARLTPH
jgi:predicted ATPase